MNDRAALIGFGEAGRAFVDAGLAANAAFDIDPAKREGIAAHEGLAEVIANASAVLSLVTADQALTAAAQAARHLAPDTLYFDLNSVAPETKRAAAVVIATAGGRYLDVAVMAPVYPTQLAVPLLLAGSDAEAGAGVLRALGFTNVRALTGGIGQASSVKMIRSVLIKGIEALTAEMLLAGAAADVTDEVLASLGGDWARQADYNLDRMLVHGTRRAAEMSEVAKTLEALGIEPLMTRGTIRRQALIGAIGAGSPPGLTAKLRIAA